MAARRRHSADAASCELLLLPQRAAGINACERVRRDVHAFDADRQHVHAYVPGVPRYPDPDGFAEWEATVPESYRRDPIWKTPAYRFGLWLSDLVKQDVKAVLTADPDRHFEADQLRRAVGAISGNLAEGYGRSSSGERAKYYDYALAETREARDWYFKVRDVLGLDTVEQRHSVLERIVRILSVVIPREREEGQKRGRRRRFRKKRPPPNGTAGA